MTNKNFLFVGAGGLMILALFVIMMASSPSSQVHYGGTVPTSASQPSGPPLGAPPSHTAIVILDAEKNFGETGAAAITQVSGGIQVEVSITGEASGASQPAHLHSGTCAAPGAVVYPLNPVVGGASLTVLSNVSLADFNAKMPLILNVHKSAAAANVYVACGSVSGAL